MRRRGAAPVGLDAASFRARYRRSCARVLYWGSGGLKAAAWPSGCGIVKRVPAREVAQAMARAMGEFPDIDVTLCAFSRDDREAVEGLGESVNG